MSSRQPTYLFFASPKKSRQKKGDPTEAVRLGPDCSAVLGVWGLAPNSLCSLRSRRSDKRREVRGRSVLSHAAPNPCAPRRLPRGPRATRSLLRNFPCPRLASHRQGEAEPLEPMRSEACLVLVFPFGRAEQHRALRGARQRASTSDFGRLFERSGRRPRSEFCPTRKDRAAQGSPRTARAEEAGVASLPPFLSIQERRSAAGTKSRRGLTQ